jgi:hypothetical protein
MAAISRALEVDTFVIESRYMLDIDVFLFS